MAEFDEKIKAAFDAEFERTRPRPGLRGRVIANAVATPRIRQRAWLTPRNLALVGAAAAVLVAAGIGFRNATQGPLVATKPTPSSVPLAFGKLPPPALHPFLGLGGGSAVVTIPYFGPAKMTWAGQLPTVPASAPVYKFALPTTTDADSFATRLGGKLTSPGSGLEPRAYQMPGFVLSVQMNDPAAGEPTFALNSTGAAGRNVPFTEDAARQAADAELQKRGLAPSWRTIVTVSRLQGFPNAPVVFNVLYQRVIPLADGSQAPEVDGNGEPSGIVVTVDSEGHLLRIGGLLRLISPPSLTEQQAYYPLRAPSTVVNAATSAPPSGSGPIPTPVVALTKVTLVYTVVTSNGVGYLVPAYLFTGTFDLSGSPNEKRVLVPALAPSAIK